MTDHINYQNRHKRYAKHKLDRTINKAFSNLKMDKEGFKTFQQLLLHVQQTSGLINISMGPGKLWPEACHYIQGLYNLSYYYKEFIRPIDAWRPSDNSNRRIFASLIHHLFAKYETPCFLNEVWLRKRNRHAIMLQNWHIKISQGSSVRKLNDLMRMTKKMEHYFLKAPDHFSTEEAIRYSQVLGLGGKKCLAKSIIATRLGQNFEHEAFWRSVIQFFIKIKDLNIDYVNPIVDFLYNVKIAKREVHTDNNISYLDPPQPDFSMKGRTFDSIMRLVENWHHDLTTIKSKSFFTWSKSELNDYQYLEETQHPLHPQRIWRITELLTSSNLELEGKMMRHCVSTYASSCFRRKTTIWSMKKETNNTIRRILTIEVDPFSRTIIQARGKCNSRPNTKSYTILVKWAKKEGLKLGMGV